MRRRKKEKVLRIGREDSLLYIEVRIYECVVQSVPERPLADADAARRVPLRIRIHHEDLLSPVRQTGCKIDVCRCLADAAFLIEYSNCLAHHNLLRAQYPIKHFRVLYDKSSGFSTSIYAFLGEVSVNAWLYFRARNGWYVFGYSDTICCGVDIEMCFT